MPPGARKIQEGSDIPPAILQAVSVFQKTASVFLPVLLLIRQLLFPVSESSVLSFSFLPEFPQIPPHRFCLLFQEGLPGETSRPFSVKFRKVLPDPHSYGSESVSHFPSDQFPDLP